MISFQVITKDQKTIKLIRLIDALVVAERFDVDIIWLLEEDSRHTAKVAIDRHSIKADY